jgi:hypothetical protein
MSDELHDFREAWLRETTRPRGDGQERVERAIRVLYRALGRATPPMAWFPSPMAAADELGGPRQRQNVSAWRVGGQPPGESLARSFETAVRTALERQLPSDIRVRGGAAMVSAAYIERTLRFADVHPTPVLLQRAYAEMRIYGELDISFDPVWGLHLGEPEFRSGFYGAHLDWLARYAFCREHAEVRFTPDSSRQFEAWLELVRCCSAFWPYEGVVVVARPPSFAHFDAQWRLHHPSRPALEYSDGSHYFWRGTRVPASWIVDPSGVKAAHLLFWSSAEERRVGLEIVGWDRLLRQLSPESIDRDADPTVGELLEARMPDGETLRFLRVRCGTGREFVLSVPPTMRAAREANAWTYGLTQETYELEART